MLSHYQIINVYLSFMELIDQLWIVFLLWIWRNWHIMWLPVYYSVWGLINLMCSTLNEHCIIVLIFDDIAPTTWNHHLTNQWYHHIDLKYHCDDKTEYMGNGTINAIKIVVLHQTNDGINKLTIITSSSHPVRRISCWITDWILNATWFCQ